MNLYQDIHAALRTHLRSMPSVPDIAMTNYDFDAQANQTYLKEYFLPGETIKACYGRAGKDLYNGIYQVSVHIPDNTGLSTLPDQIANHFYLGELTNDDATVEVLSISQGVGLNDDTHYIIPVSIRWQSYTAARI